ncbi:unnamed protein product [Larinioides sclopetarius]|uniref:Uncharacterized protein n=1 Tax=Larinioides sclopetarius TaxID=280406 RepID=A0AAV2C2H0_9ARAC
MSQCWIDLDPWQWQLYITLVAASLFFVPALVIAALHRHRPHHLDQKQAHELPEALKVLHRRQQEELKIVVHSAPNRLKIGKVDIPDEQCDHQTRLHEQEPQLGQRG